MAETKATVAQAEVSDDKIFAKARSTNETIFRALAPSSEALFPGFSVKRSSKRSSKLHVLQRNSDGEEFVNNRRLKESNLAVWELLHTYLADIFPTKIRERLLGIFGEPQVAPIVQNSKGENKTFYRDRLSSAYSKTAGLATHQFATELGLTKKYDSYRQITHSRTKRWLVTIVSLWSESFLKADISGVSEDQKNELKTSLANFWNEFNTVNPDRYTPYIDEMQGSNEGPYTASLALIESSHKVCEALKNMYYSVKSNSQGNSPMSEEEKELLFQLHLQQGATQQMILWWFGLAHYHLHPSNITVRGNTDPSIDSPIISSVIDFDKAFINSHKLMKNDELYEAVNPDTVKQKIFDQNVPIQIRHSLILYLPVNHWDEKICAMIENSKDDYLVSQAYDVLVHRLQKDIGQPDTYARMANFVYTHILEIPQEKMMYTLRVDAFLESISQTPTKLLSEVVSLELHPDIEIYIKYFTQGLESISPQNISEVPLQNIFRSLGDKPETFGRITYTESEVHFLKQAAKRTDSAGSRAKEILAYIEKYSPRETQS